ncbi:MAG: DUF4432 family protein [Bacteroidia bacterium]|nr:MAG: DUF4432 family protein [Bacteroidia bacterium]
MRIRNGLGLDLTLLPGIGLDIFDLYYEGTPLAWISKNEVVNSHRFDGAGLGWLKSFAGGMMVT